jgi:peptide/nickel transport system ATP-binding protein
MDQTLSRDEQAQRIETALREVGLDPADVLHKWPHQLSGGQLQRAMIARALVVGPELLIADEPTSMVDASLRVTVLNMLMDLRHRHAMSILFITHDLGQAYYMSDRILVMYQGAVVEQGPVERVLAHPQHAYTQRLLADVPRLRSGAVSGMERTSKTTALQRHSPGVALRC